MQSFWHSDQNAHSIVQKLYKTVYEECIFRMYEQYLIAKLQI